MSDLDCRHRELVLLPPPDKKFRCRHCHLTIGQEELANGYCPECYEVYGLKRCDFEPLEPDGNGNVRYACENCGAIIDS